MRGQCVLKIGRDYYVTRLLKLVEILSMSNHRACMSSNSYSHGNAWMPCIIFKQASFRPPESLVRLPHTRQLPHWCEGQWEDNENRAKLHNNQRHSCGWRSSTHGGNSKYLPMGIIKNSGRKYILSRDMKGNGPKNLQHPHWSLQCNRWNHDWAGTP